MATLYAAQERKAVFVETLDQFRLDTASLTARDAAISSGVDAGFDVSNGNIPAHYFTRRIVRFGVARGQR